jgi:hypothetical protein
MDSGHEEPSVSRLPALPFSDLSWERFEQFAHDLVCGLRNMRPETAHRYGTQGQAQQGIDVIVDDNDNKSWGFSNKRYKQYHPSDVQKHIADTTYAADRHVILISGTASSSVRDEVRKHPNWELWDAEDLSQKLRLAVPVEITKRIVDHHFGPRWRKLFLGLPAVCAFLPAVDYFRPYLDRTRLFHHSIPLVGRSEILIALNRVADSTDKRIAILPGRGGIGKSRIVRAFADQYDAAHPTRSLRLLNEGVPIDVEALDELPPVPCVVIVDDAHRLSDLGLLLAWLREHRDCKLVLATRPQGVDFLGSELTRAGMDPSEIEMLPAITDLSISEVRELAVQVLRPGQEELADRLVRATHDCPLVTVVGGRLLADRAVAPELLERDADFRQAVLNRFRDEMLGKVVDVVPSEVCRRLLELIAALNPVSVDSHPLHARMAAFVNTSPSDVTRALGQMERAGLLVRRGRFLRITPDVLADHVLFSACLTSTGTPTGFADEVFDAFASDCLAALLRNFAELDWRIRAEREHPVALLDGIWNKIQGEFIQGGHQNRTVLLHGLREFAYFVPHRVLALVQLAIRSPASEPPEEIFSGRFSYSQASVVGEFPELLRRCAYSESCLVDCLEVLWDMQRPGDDVEVQENADSAFRILVEIAQFAPSKPLRVNRTVLQAARRWLQLPDAFDRRHSPLDVVDSLFAKSGEESWSDSHQLYSRGFLINHANVQELRKELLSLVEGCLQSKDIRVVVRAVQSLGRGLQDPLPIYNMTITEETVLPWESEQLRILEVLSQLMRATEEPLVVLEILKAVRPISRYGRLASVKNRAGSLICSIRQTFELRVTRMLIPELSQWDDFSELDDEGTGDLVADQDRHLRALAEPVAAEFWSRFPKVADAVTDLERLLSDARRINTELSAGDLVWWLLKARPDATLALLEEILQRPASSLVDCVGVALSHLRAVSPEDATRIANRALDIGNTGLRRAVGNFCRWQFRAAVQATAEDVALVQRLLDDVDVHVRRSGISLLKSLARFQPRDALDRALAVEIGDNVELASELCQLADAQQGVPAAFSVGDWRAFLEKLDHVSRLNYHIATFMKVAHQHVPNELIQSLLKRVARSKREVEFYPPEPRELSIILSDAEPDRDSLVAIRNYSKGRSGAALRDLADIFAAASHGYDSLGMEVLTDWLVNGDETELRAAVGLLQAARPTLPFDCLEQIDVVLERASTFGKDCLDNIEYRLLSLMTSGVRHGIPGQPFPEDIALRDRCREVIGKLRRGSRVSGLVEMALKSAESGIHRASEDYDS